MAQKRCLCFELSHLWVKTGQFKPLGSQLERSLKALFHEPSSLNDHFLSVAITKPLRYVAQDITPKRRWIAKASY